MIEDRGLLGLIEQGGTVMLPLLACSVVSCAIVLERLWTIGRAARRAARLHALVCESAADGDVREALAIARNEPSPLGAVFRAVLSHPEAEETLRSRLAGRRLAEATRQLRRHVWLLGTVGSLAPFIGLLGTVIGIIRAFENMAATGSGGFAVVAAGISEALIATAAGLLVGVLSIFAYNAFTVRIATLTAVWRDWTEELLVQLALPRPREGTLPRVAHTR